MEIKVSEIPIVRSYIDTDRDTRIIDALTLLHAGYRARRNKKLEPVDINQIKYDLADRFIDRTTRHRLFVAELDDLVVGALNYDPEPRMMRCGYVERVVVHPKYRGQGIAPQLIGEVAYTAMQEGLEALRLRARSRRIERQYRRLGFACDEPGNTEAIKGEPLMSAPVMKLARLSTSRAGVVIQ